MFLGEKREARHREQAPQFVPNLRAFMAEVTKLPESGSIRPE
jgi:hypothetical protein